MNGNSNGGGYGHSSGQSGYGSGQSGYGSSQSGYGSGGGGQGGQQPDPHMLMQQIQQLQKTVMQLQAGQAAGGGGNSNSGGGGYGSGYGSGGWGGAYGGGGSGGFDSGYGPNSGFGGGYGYSNGGGGQARQPPRPQGMPRSGGGGGGQRRSENRENKVGEGEEIPNSEARVLLVSNLPGSLCHPDSLFCAFQKFGVVERVKILHNKRNTALVQMQEPSHAARAVNEQECLTRIGTDIYVNFSTKFKAVSLPEPGSPGDDGLTKDFTGEHPELRTAPQPMMNHGYGMDNGGMFGSGGGPMGGFGGGGGMMGGMDDGMNDFNPNGGNNVVLLVSNLPDEVANVDSIFNMLGVYGDVLCVKILRNKRDCALVQMAKPHHAQQVRNYLDQAKIGGNKLCISNSRVDSLLNKKLMTDEGLQKDFSNSRAHRFRNHQQAMRLQRNLSSPTSVLHIANIPEGYTHVDIKEMFVERGFTIKDSRDCAGNSHMCFLTMTGPDEALMALSQMHNHAPEDLKFRNTNGLCVSFSKAKKEEI